MGKKARTERIRKASERLFRTPDNWPSMERRDQPGTPRNIMFVPMPGDIPSELIERMRNSFCAEVENIVANEMDEFFKQSRAR
jgi:hypothetical protein